MLSVNKVMSANLIIKNHAIILLTMANVVERDVILDISRFAANGSKKGNVIMVKNVHFIIKIRDKIHPKVIIYYLL